MSDEEDNKVVSLEAFRKPEHTGDGVEAEVIPIDAFRKPKPKATPPKEGLPQPSKQEARHGLPRKTSVNEMGKDIFNYEEITANGLLVMVRDILSRIQQYGVADHEFYITFDVQINGVVVPRQFQDNKELTIVLQHRFSNLVLNEDNFAVTLFFGGLESEVVIPWCAIISLVDRARDFGLQIYNH